MKTNFEDLNSANPCLSVIELKTGWQFKMRTVLWCVISGSVLRLTSEHILQTLGGSALDR